MKLFIASVSLIISSSLSAQSPCWGGATIYPINFDDGLCMEGLYIDTSSNANNIWEIGIPQKNTFISAHSVPNVIVTDKLNPYPANDTSSFIIYHVAGAGFYFNYAAAIEGYYSVNSDSLNDFGSIELSPDNGNTWYDIVNDVSFASSWWSSIPTLTGNSNGWNYFYFDVLSANGILGIVSGDTLQYRFTFISDNNPESLDGLMFDNFVFQDYIEGIDEPGFNQIQSNAFPNPVTNKVTIEFDNPLQTAFEITVIDAVGKEILERSGLNKDSATLDISELEAGIYTYIIQSPESKAWSSGKIVRAN